MDNTAIAERLFEALANQDEQTVRNLCAPGFRVRQNSGPAMDLETLLSFNRAVGAVVKDFRYRDARRVATDTGFVEEHLVTGQLPDGSQFEVMACIVADIENGKVIDVREYLDTAAAAGLLAALNVQAP